MTSTLRSTALAVAFVLAVAGAVPAQAQPVPTYTNASVVSFDVANRMLRLRLADGTERSAELDDNVAGMGDIAVGDSVLVTLRDEPGRARVSRIVKANTPAAPAVVTEVAARTAPVVVRADAAEAAYRDRLAMLARQADGVDRLWNGFKTPCKAEENPAYEGARGWLLLWDDAQAADLSGGFCRDLFNQIVDGGTTVANGVAAADSAARGSLSPEAMREMRRAYSLDWAGWGRTPPKRQEP